MADTYEPADWVTRGNSDYRPLPTGPSSSTIYPDAPYGFPICA